MVNNMKLIVESWRKFSIQEKLKSNFSAREVQRLINKNQHLKGTKAEGNLIAGGNYVLLFSEQSAKHIANRHQDGSKPGSLFNKGVNLREVAQKLLEIEPSEQIGGRVKWLGVEIGNVGTMGLKKGSPEEIERMQDYQMPDGGKEIVKITAGERLPTNQVTLVTAELGQLSDGRKALSVITMFPGGMKVDGVKIPIDRGDAAKAGLYYVVDNGSPLLQKPEKTVTKESLRKIIKKLLKESDFEVKQKIKNRIYDDVEERFADEYPAIYGMLPSMGEFENMSVEDYKKAIASEVPPYAEEIELQSMDDEDKEGSEFGF